MASSRDDFIIAIRSAFLKKSTQQKFSLLTLLFISTFIIILSTFDFKVIRYTKIIINEIVYRSSFVVSVPENLVKKSIFDIIEYTTFFKKFKKYENELSQLRSQNISNEIIQYENKELKELINDYASSSDKVLAKIIVDHDSPFLKSVIINKGSNNDIKIGTNIFDQSYLVGRVVQVNFRTSRVLLLSDLNSNVPVTVAPQNIQAIMVGAGKNYGQIKYIKEGATDEINEDSIVYTSGTGAIFKSGIPIGKLKFSEDISEKKVTVDFFSDFSQLKYVYAEVGSPVQLQNTLIVEEENKDTQGTLDTKLKLLEDEKKIIEDSNLKFQAENEDLKFQLNNLRDEISSFKNIISSQKMVINQFDIDKDELKFLRLNLLYSHKCQTQKLFSTGYQVGTPEYKRCILNKGKIDE